MLLTTERPERQHGDAEIFHPLSAEDRAVMAALRPQIEPFKGTMTGPEAREPYDGIMEQTPDAPGVSYERDEVGGVRGIWCRPRTAAPGAVVLYLHGGGYVFGSAHAYRHLAGQIAARANATAFVADYRLRPRRPLSGCRGRCADSLSRPRRSGSAGDRDLLGTLPAAASRSRCWPSPRPKHSPARASARAPRSPCRHGPIWP